MADFNEDVRVRGNITADSYTFPNGILKNEHFNSGSPLDIHKQRHQILREYSQVYGVAVATTRMVWHRAFEGGILLDFLAGNIVPATGAATVTYDLKKNGVSILGAPLVLDSTNNNPILMYPATIAAGGVYNIGDVFELYITGVAGGGVLPQGIYVQARFDENPSV